MRKSIFCLAGYLLYKRRAMKYINVAVKYNKMFAFDKVKSNEKLKIDYLWKNLSVSGNHRHDWHSFYKGFCGYFDERFIPSDIYNGLVEYTLNLRKYSICLQHKAILGNFIESRNRCNTIINVIDNVCYDHDWNILSVDEVVDKVKLLNCNVIIKPSTASGGGSKVLFLNSKDIKNDDFFY